MTERETDREIAERVVESFTGDQLALWDALVAAGREAERREWEDWLIGFKSSLDMINAVEERIDEILDRRNSSRRSRR
jgi:hypothetical protein